MFARVLRSQLKIDKLEEAEKVFRKSVVPLCKKQKGFKGAYFMSNSKTGESMIMTLWKSEEDMLASEKSHFFQEQVTKFIPFYAKAPIREAYEVALKEDITRG